MPAGSMRKYPGMMKSSRIITRKKRFRFGCRKSFLLTLGTHKPCASDHPRALGQHIGTLITTRIRQDTEIPCFRR